jgi:hypothetical protein
LFGHDEAHRFSGGIARRNKRGYVIFTSICTAEMLEIALHRACVAMKQPLWALFFRRSDIRRRGPCRIIGARSIRFQ